MFAYQKSFVPKNVLKIKNGNHVEDSVSLPVKKKARVTRYFCIEKNDWGLALGLRSEFVAFILSNHPFKVQNVTKFVLLLK